MTDSFEDRLIADMRANGGAVTAGPLAGHPLLIMVSTGAKTGTPRRSILTWTRDGGDYVVAGTAGGSPATPAWVHNIRSNPSVQVELGDRIFEARGAVVAEGPERDRLWRQHVEQLPWFADYPEKAGRVIPMVKLTPAD